MLMNAFTFNLREPDLRQVTDMANRLEELYQGAFDAIQYRRDLRWRRMPVSFGVDEDGRSTGIPRGMRRSTVERRSSVIQYEGQHAKALLMADDPMIMVRPPRTEDQAKATSCERFLMAARGRLEEATHAGMSIADTQVHYYAAYLKTYPLRRPYSMMEKAPDDVETKEFKEWAERSEEWKKKRPISDVFEYVVPSPDTVMPYRDSHGIAVVVEKKKVSEWELAEEFGLIRTKSGEYAAAQAGVKVDESWDPTRDVEVLEYWDRQWRVIVARGTSEQIIDSWEHRFGIVPYFEFPALETSEIDPEFRQVPLLWSLYPEVENDNRLQTMQTSVAHMTAFPKYVIETDKDAEIVQDEKLHKPKTFRIDAGLVDQLNPGQHIKQIELRSGFDLTLAMQNSQDTIRQYAMPPIATGRAPASDSPAWGTALLRRYVVSLLDPLVRGQAMATASFMRFWLWAIKYRIGQTVYVNAELFDKKGKLVGHEPICVSPDDIMDFDIQAIIQPNIANERTAQEEHGASMVERGLRSKQTFLEEDAGRQAPEEEIRRIDRDEMVAAIKTVFLERAVQWLQAIDAPGMILEGGMTPEQAMKTIKSTEEGLGQPPPTGGVGTGSPGLPREPGVLMPPSLPIGASPTNKPQLEGQTLGMPVMVPPEGPI